MKIKKTIKNLLTGCGRSILLLSLGTFAVSLFSLETRVLSVIQTIVLILILFKGRK